MPITDKWVKVTQAFRPTSMVIFPKKGSPCASWGQCLSTFHSSFLKLTCDKPKYIDTVSDMYKNLPSEAKEMAKPSKDCKMWVPSCSSNTSMASPPLCDPWSRRSPKIFLIMIIKKKKDFRKGKTRPNTKSEWENDIK